MTEPPSHNEQRFYRLSRDGTPICVTTVGSSGPAVVVVHGGMDSAESWAAVAARLCERFTVHLLERRGHGRSGPGTTPHALEREVEDIAAVVAHARRPVALVGHSYGALVALRTATTLSSAIDTLAVYEPPLTVGGPIAGPHLHRLLDATESGAGVQDTLSNYLHEVAGFPPRLAHRFAGLPQTQAMLPALLPELAAADGLPPQLDTYADISMPTLLILGARSAPHPNQDSTYALARTLPNATLALMPRRGHFAHRSHPAELAGILRAHLSQHLHRPSPMRTTEQPGVQP